MRYEIYRVLDKDEEVPFLTYETTFLADPRILSVGAMDATLEELVDFCDHDAEDCNAHDFCGAHRLLGAVLFRQYGREGATATMREIALFGGLHGMGGICRDGDAYEELGVGENGYDWDGEYR